jgi:hypothetical protein
MSKSGGIKSSVIRGILMRTKYPRSYLKQPEEPEFPREQLEGWERDREQEGKMLQKTHIVISTWPDG